jgi:restriction endonuclease S subunit
MIPADWKKATIGALCNMVKGKAPIMKTKPGDYPLVTMGEEHKTADSYQFDSEAVCVPMISSFGHGKPGLKRVHYINGKFALSNILTALIVKEPEELSTKYLALYLQTFKDQLIVPLQTGAANMSLRPEKLAVVPVHYPSLKEQEQIVEIVDEVNSLMELRNNAQERSNELMPAIFFEIFGDLGTNSKGWKTTTIAQVTERAKTKDPSKEPNRKFWYIDISAVDGSLGAITSAKLLFGSEAPSRARQIVKANDVIVSTVRPNLRATALVASEFDNQIASTGFCVLRPSPDISAHYLYAITRQVWFTNILVSKVRGANYPAISDRDILGLGIPLPPMKQQKAFSDQIRKIHEFQVFQSQSASKLERLHNSVLGKAFSGAL